MKTAVARVFRTPPQFISFFQEFNRLEVGSGVSLIVCTVLALLWANSPWASAYEALWELPLVIGIASRTLSMSLLHWINDGLMAVFFLVVGLEIKREVLMGELKSPRRAAVPIAAALGGMIVPAVIYAAFNWGRMSIRGWGVPMATDIAFTLGVLALLSRRVPLGLKVFLTALAIVDDLGAVLVIALFYSHGLNVGALLAALFILVTLVLLNRLGVRQRLPYLAFGVLLWLALLQSGVHATVAGVLLAVTVPARTHVNTIEFLRRTQDALAEFERHHESSSPSAYMSEPRQAAAQALEAASEAIESPLHSLEHDLHPWVTRLILPIFALANAGVALNLDNLSDVDASPILLGVFAGLVIGKPLGISTFLWLAVRLGIAEFPAGMTWRSVIGGSMLAGIGFTMSIFIGSLAFDLPETLAVAKVAIIAASVVAGCAGWLFIRTQISLPELPATEEAGLLPDARTAPQ